MIFLLADRLLYICQVYADAQHMYRYHICRWPTYEYALHILSSLIFRTDPKKARVGSPRTAPARCSTETQDVAVQSAAVATRCCVMTLPCGPARRGRKDRFASSLTVVHFRKNTYTEKSDLAEAAIR
ncbi:hypothetical protein ROD_p1361 (plasmid) [Citrobacter rodentium ICC168]|uniref:Uncharacterized protein n=1 Tax=Citrobacter rodentium (strain ICC168) TaxID=637910 RepID=D2TV54_CITRI|nr:hypothetical protein ROD_p1361 [Citrobacter rodentium ICC168]